jgi:hypothetical protein
MRPRNYTAPQAKCECSVDVVYVACFTASRKTHRSLGTAVRPQYLEKLTQSLRAAARPRYPRKRKLPGFYVVFGSCA